MEQQLLEEIRAQNRLLRRLLWVGIVCAALLVCMLVGGAVIATSLNDTFRQVSTSLQKADLAALSRAISQLDMGELNEAIAQLGDQLAKLDMNQLNETLAQMNTASSRMSEAGDAMKRFAEGLAGLFGR